MINFLPALPFGLLLLSIAIFPLALPHFWEKNKNKAIVVLVISIPSLFWLINNEPTEILHTMKEYFSFICLLGSLFVISGGISVTGDLKATPRVNTIFLAIGAVLANFIGTTGASMVLIRPFLRTNSERINKKHIPVFFIFVVANCGGLLTPLGDPPLFLGYLRGVPFLWTLKLFPIWLTMNGILLAVFYIWDKYAYSRETPKTIQSDNANIQPLRFQGLTNILFLSGVLYSVFMKSPWREFLMIHMAMLSIFLGSKTARKKNHFNWAPIIEVATIFAGIFITMIPALLLLKENAPQLGINSPAGFFWSTGLLSGVLDNAPTYLTFISIAQGLNLPPDIIGIPTEFLKAISVGAVFMGANTYIGNGPNFMVKAIADHAGFHTPSFLGYILYTLAVLMPTYVLITLIFF